MNKKRPGFAHILKRYVWHFAVREQVGAELCDVEGGKGHGSARRSDNEN